MNIKTILKKQIERFIIQNSENFSKSELYTRVVDEFGIDRKTVSRYYLELEKSGILKSFNKLPETRYTDSEISKVLRQDSSGLSVSLSIDHEVKSLADLLEVCDVDVTQWEVVSWECKKWDLGIKNAENSIETKQLFSVSAKFKPVVLETNLKLQKEVLLKELFDSAPKTNPAYEEGYNGGSKFAYEISLPDIHFGKFAWGEETGQNYDLKIAEKEFKTAVDYFLTLPPINNIERFIFPIGNDLINIDSRKAETTAGTKVDSDSRFFKIVKVVKRILIESIDKLANIAPVDVVIVSGNHDYETMFMLGEILSAYYANNTSVTVDNTPTQRKYYKYGKCGFLYTHGNEEKHADLGLIFATENAKLWAESTACRHIKLGHFHKNKKLTFVNVDEYTGFTIQILPSLSGRDFWHSSKGYMSKRAAKAFLYHKDNGLVGEFSYNI